MRTSRLPRAGKGVVVVEAEEDRCRVLSVAREPQGARLLGFESSRPGEGPEALLARLDSPFRKAVVVTSAARTELREALDTAGPLPGDRFTPERATGWALDPSSGAPPRRDLYTTVAAELRDAWKARLAALGLKLEGVYPLFGAALAGVHLGGRPRPQLVLQLERRGFAVIEALGTRCLDLQVYAEPPSVERCAELIGPACPEVVLCGGGVDLSRFGYDLARAEHVWPRLASLLCVGDLVPRALAAPVGAARHALGLGAADAVVCVPPA